MFVASEYDVQRIRQINCGRLYDFVAENICLHPGYSCKLRFMCIFRQSSNSGRRCLLVESFQVQNEDQMPRQICSECKQLLITYYLFKQKSKRTEEALQLTFGNSLTVVEQVTCSQCEQCFDNEEEFDAHTQNGQCMSSADTTNLLDDLEGIAKCMDGDNQTDDIVFELAEIGENSNESSNTQDSSYSQELQPPAKKKAKILSSNECDQSDAPGLSSVKKLPRRSTRSIAQLVEKDATQSEDDDYMEYVDDDDESLMDHDSADDEDPLLNYQFIRSHSKAPGELLDSSSGTKSEFFCVPCNKKLRSSLQVDQHTKMHNSMSMIINYIDFYPCHECRIIFITGEKMAAHMNEHHQFDKPSGEKKASNSLDKIDDSCTDYQFLEDDRDDNEYKDGAYSCGDCGLSFPSANELKYHVILHANKFQCPIFECGCQYNQLSRLSIHVINKHINAKLRQCLHCGKPFDSFDELQLHLKADCREKKFQCHHCGECDVWYTLIPPPIERNLILYLSFRSQTRNFSRRKRSSHIYGRFE